MLLVFSFTLNLLKLHHIDAAFYIKTLNSFALIIFQNNDLAVILNTFKYNLQIHMKMVLWDSAAGEQTQILFEKVMLLPPANVQLIISLLHQAYNLHDTNYPQCIYITSS